MTLTLTIEAVHDESSLKAGLAMHFTTALAFLTSCSRPSSKDHLAASFMVGPVYDLTLPATVLNILTLGTFLHGKRRYTACRIRTYDSSFQERTIDVTVASLFSPILGMSL
jgi:hypothetical protein